MLTIKVLGKKLKLYYVDCLRSLSAVLNVELAIPVIIPYSKTTVIAVTPDTTYDPINRRKSLNSVIPIIAI